MVGAVFVDQVRLHGAVEALRAEASHVSAALAVRPIDDVGDRGGTGAAAIAGLCAAVDELNAAFGLHVGFAAAAIEAVGASVAAADQVSAR